MAYPKVLSFQKKRKNKNKNLQYLIKSVLKLWSHSKVLHLDLGPLVISAMLEFWNYAYRTLNLFFPPSLHLFIMYALQLKVLVGKKNRKLVFIFLFCYIG